LIKGNGKKKFYFILFILIKMINYLEMEINPVFLFEINEFLSDSD